MAFLLNLTAMIATVSAQGLLAQEQKAVMGRKLVRIEASPETGIGPIWVNFTPFVQNLEEPLKFEWYFGDGTQSTINNPPAHRYEAGKYTVVLTVTDKTAEEFTASKTVNVEYPCG